MFCASGGFPRLAQWGAREALSAGPSSLARAFSSAQPAAAAQPQPKPTPPSPPPPPPQSDFVEVFVDGQPISVPKTFTAIQACDAAGVDIPRWVAWHVAGGGHARVGAKGGVRVQRAL